MTARRSRHPICSSRTETSCSHRSSATNGLRKSGRDWCRGEIAWNRRTGGRRHRSPPMLAPCAAVSGGGYSCTDRLPVHTRVTRGKQRAPTSRDVIWSTGIWIYVGQAEAVTPLPSEATSGAGLQVTGTIAALLTTVFFAAFLIADVFFPAAAVFAFFTTARSTSERLAAGMLPAFRHNTRRLSSP